MERLTVGELPLGPVFALDPEGEDIRSLKLPDDALLAFGSERSGLSAELRARADHLVALPMRPQVSSYNLATSAAMTLYHWSATGAHPTRHRACPADHAGDAGIWHALPHCLKGVEVPPAALSSVARAPPCRPPPPCSRTHRTPLTRAAEAPPGPPDRP
ncbi:hypothetical protein SHKM778_00590 [Streptomyces sp. KM77-8]|uniref:tRNA/rRNA methyltransferase SpoU type domain-containing protein n=1 Tax=Streptomyces haneummycinicus TaxID=3074435 RepID=A0AAT9H8E8_9ACTN